MVGIRLSPKIIAGVLVPLCLLSLLPPGGFAHLVQADTTFTSASVGTATDSCGDGTCNGSETCNSCPGDCGNCAAGGGGRSSNNSDSGEESPGESETTAPPPTQPQTNIPPIDFHGTKKDQMNDAPAGNGELPGSKTPVLLPGADSEGGSATPKRPTSLFQEWRSSLFERVKSFFLSLFRKQAPEITAPEQNKQKLWVTTVVNNVAGSVANGLRLLGFFSSFFQQFNNASK